ncbi:hypothetical protein NW760_012614 [Fusarium oxysporum]|nr:hypothetical protein NW760_012614 [Fusarium oxysporum]
MSGIEIIGVVLGAFPIAVMALEKYSKLATSVNLFYSIRSEHKRCLDDLTYHQILFKIHLRRLLLPLAVDDDKIDELLDNPGGTSWKEKSIDDVLKRRMKDAYLPYFGYVKEMARVMNDLNQRLALDSEAVQNNLSNQKALKGIERLRFEASPERIAFQRFRIKFSNGESDRKRLLSEFENYNGKLKALLDFSDEEARLTQQRKLMFHNSATDLAVCNFWKQAAKLFRALTSACYFTAELKKAVQILEGVSIQQPNHRQLTPTKSSLRSKGTSTYLQVADRTPSVTLTCIDRSAQCQSHISQEISVLCSAIRNVEGACCGYLRENDCRFYVYTLSRENTAVSPPYITLCQILQGEFQPPPTRSQRYTIALVIASSFLQLLESQWLPATLKKTEIFFRSDPSNSTRFRLDQPYIRRQFNNSNEKTVPYLDPGATELADSLDQLGIILLELCFGKVLEQQPCRKKWPDGRDAREVAGFNLLAARDWQCQVPEEAGPDYAEAVGWCLDKGKSRPPERWRKDMLQSVIHPLQRCREYLAGS